MFNFKAYQTAPIVDQLCHGDTESSIKSGGGYYKLRLLDMGVGNTWNFTQRYIPIFHIAISGGIGDGYTMVYDPLPNIVIEDKEKLRLAQNTVINPRDLTPYIPYREIHMPPELWMGLFAMPSRDLFIEVIGLVNNVAGVLGQLEVKTAAELASSLYKNVNSLLGTDGTVGRVAWKGQIGGDETLTSTICLVAETELIDQKHLLGTRKQRLHLNNQPVTNYDYFLFELKVVKEHDQWMYFKDIKEHYNAWKLAGYLEPTPEQLEFNKDLLENLSKVIQSSDDLVNEHKDSIITDLYSQIDRGPSRTYIPQPFSAPTPESDLFDVPIGQFK